MHFDSQNGICMYKPAIYHKDNKRLTHYIASVVIFLAKYLDYY